ncbi:ABC transporter ATP-binding protein [Roseateles sp. DAIF2]|uniref:ABC transporter ATP-binding protein n=1 Tax=Roseateles sp. DAIF2 TaxID=2714952 RepID=UPI0018A2FC67|nr:ABC transporter ATP-binding protein [Roseateles sp. DAIF2]QPF76165.1 ABC transporter ATP-binding protein [Roseateles sp. DAIF2]
MSSEVALQIEGLVKRYGEQRAVDGLDLRVESGEIYALLGPNGAGKSTTIACTLGFLRPDAGSVRLAGAAPPEAAIRHAAYISENVALYERLSGIENVEFFMRLQGQRPRRAEIEGWLARAGLPEQAWARQAGTYSKGMRQKVGIVMALAKAARVLVLDEPTSGLDPQASIAFGALIRELAAERGTAVLIATHDLFRAQELAQRCGMLVGGRLLGEWRLASLAAGELERHYLSTLAEAVA